MMYKLIILSTVFAFFNCKSNVMIKSKDGIIKNTGEFIMTPKNTRASFSLDFQKNSIEIQEASKKTIISLQQMYEYQDRYTAPKGRKLIKEKTHVIHISKNVFNNNDSIEILIQAAFAGSRKEKYEPFVIDFLLNESGKVTLYGSTYQGTRQRSDPVFAIVDEKAYYGIYDDYKLIRNSLKPHQKLNGVPHIMESGFRNGVIVFKKMSWEYAQQKGCLLYTSPSPRD